MNCLCASDRDTPRPRRRFESGGASRTAEASGQGAAAVQLTPDEQAQVRKLQARDREVRAHEMAHIAAARNASEAGSTFMRRRPDPGL